MGAMVDWLRQTLGWREKNKDDQVVGEGSFRLGGGAGQCVTPENPDFLAASIPARTESLL